MKRTPLLALAAAAALAATGFVAALFTGGGCASDCGNNCPNTAVYVGSANNQELNGLLVDLDVSGPACPPRTGITCAGNRLTTTCTYVLVTAVQPGACDVLFVFSDRPNEILHLQFGPTSNANGSCCKGYPPLGPSVYTIPAKPTGPIYSGSADAGTYSSDGIVVLTDAAPDAPHDAGMDAPADAGAP